MPSGFAALDTGFPNLSGYSTTEEKLKAMEDYLVQLLEQLRYTLHNMGVENMNTTEVTGWLDEIITEPIQAEITDVENGLSTRIDANAGAITAEVTRATGAESVIQQSADAIKAQVTDGQGNYTVLNLKSDGLHIGNAAGTTTINGSSIETGSIKAAQIESGTITSNEIHANTISLGNLSSAVTNSFGDPNPNYIKNTYIDATTIVSPTIRAGTFYGNEFNIMPQQDSSGQYIYNQSGSLNLYGLTSLGSLYNFFKVSYYFGDYPEVTISSPAAGEIRLGSQMKASDVFEISSYGELRVHGKMSLGSGYNFGTSSQRDALTNKQYGQLFFVI